MMIVGRSRLPSILSFPKQSLQETLASTKKGTTIITVISNGPSKGNPHCVVSPWVVKKITNASGNDY